MLVLSRKHNERIHIGTKSDYLNGNQIIISCFAENCPRIGIGLAAPPELIILREELVNKFIEKLKNESDSGQ